MKKTNTEPRSIQELESWQILEELARIAAIKDELKALNLKADQSDPDTGYKLSDILLYEEGLLKEVRARHSNVSVQRKEVYHRLNEELGNVRFIPYSPERLVKGKFGKVLYGKRNEIVYVLLSDTFLDWEVIQGYFYPLSAPTIGCGMFDIDTGIRHETCRVIEIEDTMDESKVAERYNYFLRVWRE